MKHKTKQLIIPIICSVVIISGCAKIDVNSIKTDSKETTSFSSLQDEAINNALQASTETGDIIEAHEEFDPSSYIYYYELLDDDEKLVYRQIYDALLNLKEDVELSTTDIELVTKLHQYVILDNPDIFYIDTFQYTCSTTSSGDIIKLTYSAVPSMDDSTIEEAKTALSNYSGELIKNIGITPLTITSSDEYTVALGIYSYLIDHTDYVDDSIYNQSMYSLLLGQTVCQGYATSFKYFCDMYNIPCIIVTGNADGVAHAWNQVFLNGYWCNIDCTYGDGNYIDKGISYTWFGFSDQMASFSRETDFPQLLPTCDSDTNDFYNCAGLYFDTYNLDQISELAASEEDNYLTFKFSNISAYSAACNNLFEDSSIAKLIPNGGSLNYVTDDSSYTMYILLYPN